MHMHISPSTSEFPEKFVIILIITIQTMVTTIMDSTIPETDDFEGQEVWDLVHAYSDEDIVTKVSRPSSSLFSFLFGFYFCDTCFNYRIDILMSLNHMYIYV